MANVTQARKVLTEITGISNLATSARKFSGKNYGRLLRDLKGLPALNDAIVNISGTLGTIPKQIDRELITIGGAGMSLESYCGQYYDFNKAGTKIDIDLINSPATLVERFNLAAAVSIGFYVLNEGSASKQTVLVGSNNSPFRLSINTDNTLELRCSAYKNGVPQGAATASLGVTTLNTWTVNLIVLDFANQLFSHYVNGTLVATDWPAAWSDTAGNYSLTSLYDQDMIFGKQISDIEYFNGGLAGFFVTPKVCTTIDARNHFSILGSEPCDDEIFFPCDQSKPTSIGTGEWEINDYSNTISGVLASAETGGVIYTGGQNASGIYQRVINSNGLIDFNSEVGYCELDSAPAVGSGLNFTASIWFKVSTDPDTINYPLTMEDDSSNYIRLMHDVAGNVSITSSIAGSGISSSFGTVGADTWHHVAFSVDLAGDAVAYLDGVATDTDDATGWADFNFESLAWRIGAPLSKGNFVNNQTVIGYCVASGAMNSTQVKDLANILKPDHVERLT